MTRIKLLLGLAANMSIATLALTVKNAFAPRQTSSKQQATNHLHQPVAFHSPGGYMATTSKGWASAAPVGWATHRSMANKAGFSQFAHFIGRIRVRRFKMTAFPDGIASLAGAPRLKTC
jgi:hypothetical protein